MAATGVVIDPTKIYFVGQSLGVINGAADIAANPRITKAAFNVSGETIVDIFSNSPSQGPALIGLLATLGITPGTSAYLQFLNVAKWVLDPADPANYGDHITRNTFANLLKAGLPPPLNSDPMVPKKVMAQMAICDKHIGLGPVDSTHSSISTFVSAGASNSTACPAASGGMVKHGFLTAYDTYGSAPGSITVDAQDDIAAFFAADTLPPPTRAAP
jgi:hypothetical protein